MKKISIYLFAALAAFTFFSCNKEAKISEEEVPAPGKTGATITIKARATDTKTHIVATEAGENVTYKAYWDDEGEALGLILTPGAITASDAPAKLPGSKVGDEMIFSASGLDYADGTYKMFVFSPFDVYSESGDGYIVAELNAAQNPVKGSFDPKCDLLGYATDGVVIANGLATIEDIQLQRPMAILRVNINADSEDPAFGEVVTGLKIELPEEGMIPLAGKIKITDDGDLDLVTPEYAVSAQLAPAEAVTIGAAGDAKAVYLVTFPVTIPQNFPITFTVETENFNGESAITSTFNAKTNMALESGKVNTIELTIKAGAIEERYAGGTGIEGDPWLVATPAHMLHMAEDLVAGETKYFKLVDDIDMDGIEWTPMNADDPFDKAINLDGNNHIISNLSATLFQDLNGSTKDLTINAASVNGGSAIAGILTNMINTGEGTTVDNVDITNSSITATSYCGGLIGQVGPEEGVGSLSASITNCDVTNTNVQGTLAGGVIGFANSIVNMSGCTYSGGTVKGTSRYVGGLLGSTGNVESVITDCHVTDATIDQSSYTGDGRVGGFVGQLQTKVVVKGCTVGTSANKVIIKIGKSNDTAKGSNAGGFAGVGYGKITKNGDVRSKVYATFSTTNTNVNHKVRLGGLVGYCSGTVEYADAEVDMSTAAIVGQDVGGAVGYLLTGGKIDHCTVSGTVNGSNFTGGLIGYSNTGTITVTNNTVSGTVTGNSAVGGIAGDIHGGTFSGNTTSAKVVSGNTNSGGFVGRLYAGNISGCSVTGDVIPSSATGSTHGGFVGLLSSESTATTVNIEKCYATGNVTSGGSYVGGFGGNLNGAKTTLTISNCYATGNVSGENQRHGGFIGTINAGASISISNCYASGSVSGTFGDAGLIGLIYVKTVTVQHCAAWNSVVTASDISATKWSTGAVVGAAYPTCTLTDNYRNPAMSLTAIWVPAADYQHANVSASTPLIDKNGQACDENETLANDQPHYPIYPYHGKVEAGKTLSQLASTTLGWPADVWDFSGALPTLK